MPTSSDAYMYNADLICEDCGNKIVEQLEKKGIENTGDSNDFPQGPYSDGGGESDVPQHCKVGRLWARIYSDYLRDCRPLTPLSIEKTPFADSLIKILARLKKKEKARIMPEIFTDCSCIYGGATSPDKTTLWRVVAGDNGDYEDPETVYLPPSEAHERTLQDAIEEAISEGAWD